MLETGVTGKNITIESDSTATECCLFRVGDWWHEGFAEAVDSFVDCVD